MNHSLTHIEFNRLCEVFSSSIGLTFPLDRKSLLARSLSKAAKEFGYQSVNELISWILFPGREKAELETLAPFLTNSETYFWREANVFNAFSHTVIPELIASRKDIDKSINIWCAGCSSGEEAYSIAIAIFRTIRGIEDWKINILATDLNIKILDKARAGIYGSWSFRNSPLWLRNRYMRPLNDLEYEIVPEILEMVTFSKFNLIQENYRSTICRDGMMDIIFCRNVLMYFTTEWAEKVSKNLINSLSEDGWLVVASCELSSVLFPELKSVNFPGAVLYQKTKSDFHIPLQPLQPSPFIESGNPGFKHVQPLQCIQDLQPSSGKINYSEQRHSQHSVREKSLNETKSIVRRLADNGHLEEALSVCNKAITEYKLAPVLYYLRATILQEQDKINEAIKSLKQAVYIDPDYIIGHFSLGNLFLRQGIIKSAKQYFKNTIDLLNKLPGDDISSETEGLSAKYIREIISHNMKTKRSA